MSELNSRQFAAIPFLLAARNVTEGCQNAGIATKTYYEWMKEPAFVEEFRNRKNALIDESFDNITASLKEAASVLDGLLHSESESIRLRAVKLILEKAEKLRGDADFEKRLLALERDLKKAEDNKFSI